MMAHGYKPPPATPPAFPGVQRVRPKTSVKGGGGMRKRWKDMQTGEIYEWDSQHGALKKYKKNGKHLGEFDPVTGQQTKPANPKREVNP